MPLLHKQKFIRATIPDNLESNQEVFYSKLTQEIFLDYDEYFERTILCNSLVWTCSLTGRTGLTFAEALESEQRARRMIANYPVLLEKAIVYLITLTKRGNIKDLVDDIFGYVKDRYVIGETVTLTTNQSFNSRNDAQKICKIVDIIIPQSSTEQNSQKRNENQHSDDIKVTINSESNHKSNHKAQNSILVNSSSNRTSIDPTKYKYSVEIIPNSKMSLQTVRASQLSRSKNFITKEKIYILIKLNCDVAPNSVWTIKESARNRLNLNQIKFIDFFKGDMPYFETTFGRGQFSRNNLTKQVEIKNKSYPTKSSNNQSIKSNNKKLTNSSSTTSIKRSSDLNKSRSNHKSPQSNINNSNSIKKLSKESPEDDFQTPKSSNSSSNRKRSLQTSLSKSAGIRNYNENLKESKRETEKSFAQKLILILNKKISDMNQEEFEIWRDNKSEDDLRELTQIETEMEKIIKKEEKEKEKERIKQEKNKQKEYLKELKKPKEDFECENILEIPKATPVQSKISQYMFGDAVIILEFLTYFGDLFELKDDFPNGFNLDLLENALFSKSCDSALCNLLLFYLDSIFKCYDEETFEDSNVEAESDSKDEEANESDEEEIGLEKLYKEPVYSVIDREVYASLAEKYSKLIKNIQGRSLKTIGLDVYTISEMLRLYFLTSGSSHNSKAKFWYQQRGGYTRMDEVGIDFALNEKEILKKLEIKNVFELEPDEKLKILTTLCHQLISQVRFRDVIEDNWQKLSNLKAQLRDLQTEENRRIREEVSERWKKKLQDKAKEKARLEEIKTNIVKE